MAVLKGIQEFRTKRQLAQAHDLNLRQAAIDTVLRQSPPGARAAEEYEARQWCGMPHPCRSRYCQRCMGYVRSNSCEKLTRTDCETVLPARIQRPPKDGHSVRQSGARRIIAAFVGLPTRRVHAVTVNFCWCTEMDDLSAASRRYRQALKNLFNRRLRSDPVHGRGTIVAGKFDYVLKSAKEASAAGGNYACLPCFDPESESAPDYLAMFHGHFLLYHPTAEKDEIRRILQSEFPGAFRVRVEPIRPEIHANGVRISGGALGYAQYSSMEKLELKYGLDNVKLLRTDITLHNSWKRANANIRYGCRAIRLPNIHRFKLPLPFPRFRVSPRFRITKWGCSRSMDSLVLNGIRHKLLNYWKYTYNYL